MKKKRNILNDEMRVKSQCKLLEEYMKNFDEYIEEKELIIEDYKDEPFFENVLPEFIFKIDVQPFYFSDFNDIEYLTIFVSQTAHDELCFTIEECPEDFLNGIYDDEIRVDRKSDEKSFAFNNLILLNIFQNDFLQEIFTAIQNDEIDGLNINKIRLDYLNKEFFNYQSPNVFLFVRIFKYY